MKRYIDFNTKKRMNAPKDFENDLFKLILNKTIYVGFTVLELGKWKMYDFRYNFIKRNFDAELLFTDNYYLLSNHRKKTNRAIVSSHRCLPNIFKYRVHR